METGEDCLWLHCAAMLTSFRPFLITGAAEDQTSETEQLHFFIASEYGHADIVKGLLTAGAAKDQASKTGATPLLRLRSTAVLTLSRRF